jgi:serine protease Do
MGGTQRLSLVIGPYPERTALATGRSELPPALRVPVATPTNPGMRLADLTPENRARFELDSEQTGVLVTEVAADGPAADAGIAAGDVILQVRRHSVATPADVQRDLLALAQAHAQHVALLVRGKSGPRWVVMRLATRR